MTPRQAKADLARRKAQASLLAFMLWCWWMPHRLLVGRHTREIAARLTRAVEDFREGCSTFLLVAVPFRHGKSDLVSRALPAYFLGRCADMQPDVILSGYGASLVHGFSKRVKGTMRSRAYQELFPGVVPGRGTDSAAEWQVDKSSGVVVAQGLGGALTGKGGHLIVVDDYCKSRAEARSETYRNRTWDSFTNDLMTRRAPCSVVVVCATPWHVDDIRGRIRKKMEEDPAFPKFEELRFPAKADDGSWLFPERFSPEWYHGQYATLGRLASSLLDCEPQVEGGERFAVSRVVIHKTREGWPAARRARAWDLASSAKERDKDDPDWTIGIRGCVTTSSRLVDGTTIRMRSVWVDDLVRIRAEAPARDALIRRTAAADGPGVRQVVEAFGAYKDAAATLEQALRGVSVVSRSRLPGDKSAKAAPLEPVVEAGELHLLEADWNGFLLDQLAAFPNGAHDDAVDALAVLYHALAGGGQTGLSFAVG